MAETQPTWESGGTVSFTDKGVLYSPPTDKAAIAWLEEAARYFENRPTGGEDRAHWANVYNAENCRKLATLLASQEAEIAELRAASDMDKAILQGMRLRAIEFEQCVAALEGALKPWLLRLHEIDDGVAGDNAYTGIKFGFIRDMRNVLDAALRPAETGEPT